MTLWQTHLNEKKITHMCVWSKELLHEVSMECFLFLNSQKMRRFTRVKLSSMARFGVNLRIGKFCQAPLVLTESIGRFRLWWNFCLNICYSICITVANQFASHPVIAMMFYWNQMRDSFFIATISMFNA